MISSFQTVVILFVVLVLPQNNQLQKQNNFFLNCCLSLLLSPSISPSPCFLKNILHHCCLSLLFSPSISPSPCFLKNILHHNNGIMVIPSLPHSSTTTLLMRNYQSKNWGLIIVNKTIASKKRGGCSK